MEEKLFRNEKIEFTDGLNRTFEKLPEDALFVVDRKLLQVTEGLMTFLEGKKMYLFDASEKNKNLSELEKIYDFLLENHVSQTLIAIGGGITGDLAGYAAATFKRGIPFVMVPTTLLSMCDSSVGGKCGVNFRGIKNYIGAFRKPDRIIICLEFLKTLEERELRSGLGEILKYGLIGNRLILDDLLSSDKDLFHLPMKEYILSGLLIKSEVVQADYSDQGIRNILNFGHNVGHAIESVLEGAVTHGEAVALGILAEIDLSTMKLGLNPETGIKAMKIMDKYGLRRKISADKEKLMEAIRKDKKNDENMRFTLLSELEKPEIKVMVQEAEILEALTVILE
ncbi:3-dehydroquinate synthase family protein [Proteiniclasticum sp. C24MP]|uniref:3-dehydroquinate synthase n=1 Tax=Proteiniclasticum sp. C24MP TaxID=3374101 RepID=UPI003754A1A5